MKKYFYSLFAAAAMLFATTSCSEDEIVSQEGNEVNVSFTVQTNGTANARAIATGVEVGGGNMADKLIYAVYENGKDDVLIQNAVNETTDGEFTVTVPLAKNITYDIVFFAYNEKGNAFGIGADNARSIDLKNLKLNTDLLANQEAYDAFFKTIDDYSPKAGNTTVTLKRPFAQLNVGTTLQDLADAADLDVKVTNSQIVVKKAYNQFNAFTGVATGEVNLTYASTDILKADGENATTSGTSVNGASFEFDNEKFNVKGKDDDFYYLALAYVLASGEQAELYDVNVILYRNTDEEINTLSVPNLKLQRNYRTNIIGNLLTSQETFEVVIDEVFAEPEYNYTAWAGGVKEVTPVDGVYNIALAEELAWVAQQVNTGKNNFKNNTVKLISDIDLKNIEWTPIGHDGDASGFQGTFNGQGHTVSNLYIDQTNPKDYQSAGLFGCIAYATVTDFTIENAVVKNYTTGDATSCGTGVVVGSVNSGANQATITKVTVKNAEVSSNRYVGGILGYGAANISECKVNDIELAAIPDDADNDKLFDNGDKVGGIIGYANGAVTLTGNEVTNITATAYREIGGIAGCVLNTSSVITGNKVTTGQLVANMTVDYEETKDANVDTIIGRKGITVADSNEAKDVTTDVVTGTVTEPTYDETTKTYTVDSADDWMWFSGKSDLEDDVIIEITKDINLAGQTFKTMTPARSKALTIKGNNKTISNVIAADGGHNSIESTSSLFQSYEGSSLTIEDLSFSNVTVINTPAGEDPNAFTAVVVGYNEGTLVLKNVHVSASKVQSSNKSAGALVGLATASGTVKIENSSVQNTTVEAKYYAGSLVGRAVGKVEISNTTANQCTVVENGTDTGAIIGQRYSSCPTCTIDGAEYFDATSQEGLKTYLNTTGDAKVFLGTDVTIQGEAYANKSTYTASNITIIGNGNTLTFTDGYRTYFSCAENGKITLKDMNLVRSTTNTDTHWHNDNLWISSDVEMENVNITRGINISQNVKATLKDVTIVETVNNSYAMFILPGADVTMDNCTIDADDNTKRGIKITSNTNGDGLEMGITANTALSISNTTFKTAEKAAIVVDSHTATNITLSNIDITNVQADSEFAVWVDENAAIYYDKVTVTGGLVRLEGTEAVYAGLIKTADYTYEAYTADAVRHAFASEANVASNGVYTCKVKLMNDIDFNNAEWTPMVHPIGDIKGDFINMTLDGNNKTIKNIKFADEDGNDVGLFANFYGTVKDLNIQNVSYSGGSERVGTIAGKFVGTISNVKVSEVTLSGAEKVGGLVGLSLKTTVEGCTVSNINLTSTTKDCGGLVACISGDAPTETYTNNTVSGTVKSPQNVGALYGRAASTSTVISSTDNTTTDVTVVNE